MGKIKGFLFAVRHREILMTDLGLNKLPHFAYKQIPLQGVHLSPLGFAACQSKKCTN